MFAIELIELAIEGNYQGVVFPDTNEKYERWKKTNDSIGKITGAESQKSSYGIFKVGK